MSSHGVIEHVRPYESGIGPGPVAAGHVLPADGHETGNFKIRNSRIGWRARESGYAEGRSGAGQALAGEEIHGRIETLVVAEAEVVHHPRAEGLRVAHGIVAVGQGHVESVDRIRRTLDKRRFLVRVAEKQV